MVPVVLISLVYHLSLATVFEQLQHDKTKIDVSKILSKQLKQH